jgi:hypothetical protein
MIDDPACRAGRLISLNPAREPDDNNRRPFCIFDSFTAVRFSVPENCTNDPTSRVASTRFVAVDAGRPVISARCLHTVAVSRTAYASGIPGVRVAEGPNGVADDSPVAGERWFYFLTLWELQMEMTSCPGGRLYAALHGGNHQQPAPGHAGRQRFPVASEQYYMHTDRNNIVLAETTFGGEHFSWLDGLCSPVARVRTWGRVVSSTTPSATPRRTSRAPTSGG